MYEMLGVLAIYRDGQGVAQDYGKARTWFEKTAAQGDAAAQYNLGSLYENGQGVTRDISKAREWFEKAAAQGDESAKAALQKFGK